MARPGNENRRRDRPLAAWTEQDSVRGSEVEALVVILDGPGCSWSKRAGCTMCGYGNDVRDGVVTSDELVSQVENALIGYEDQPYLKIFTSGSFLDPAEIPHEAQMRIVSAISRKSNVRRLLIESRPEFIERESIDPLKEMVEDLEVAVGLETTSDMIRSRFICKGFTMNDHMKGAETLLSAGCLLKTYLLMKPPFLGEEWSIADMIRSISDIHEQFPGSRISVNPMNVQSFTPVERAFRRGLYRPPWLWSLVEVLKEGRKLTGGRTHLMSSPTAGGKRRGAHNCGACDGEVLDAVSRFSIDNDISHLDLRNDCCTKRWKLHRSLSVLDHTY